MTDTYGASQPSGIERIARERKRQIEEEGWDLKHDAQYRNDELTRAALAYASGNNGDWPWHHTWWKPSDDPIRNLEKAGALIAAEIDRLISRSIP